MNTICSAMRNQPANSHNDLQDVLVCLAAMVNKPMGELSDKAKAIVVDMIDEISGQVENDQIKQQKEGDWRNRQGVPIPGFERVYAELDALTVYARAA